MFAKFFIFVLIMVYIYHTESRCYSRYNSQSFVNESKSLSNANVGHDLARSISDIDYN